MGILATDLHDSSGIVEASITLAAEAVADCNGTRVPQAAGAAGADSTVFADPRLKVGLAGTLSGIASLDGQPSATYQAQAPLSANAAVVATAGGVQFAAITLSARAVVKLANSATVPFLGGGSLVEDICHDGGPVEILPAELRMRRPFPYPALETLRQRCLQGSSASAAIGAQARAVLIFATHGDFKPLFLQLTELTPEILSGKHCDRRKAVLVDKDLYPFRALLSKAVAELGSLGVPSTYQDLIQTRLASSSFNHRVSAQCAMVLLTALLLDTPAA